MPVDTRIEAELLATCHALGVNVKSGYQKSADCVECLKDLIRYLKRDDEDHSILRQLGSMKLLQNDLLPILKQYSDRKQILDLILRLLVVLTNPALLLFKEELPEDKLSNNIYLEIVGYLQIYKEAFIDVSIWTVLNNCLQKLLENSYADRDEEDRFTVERILIVTRNVLHVTPDYISEKRTDDDVNVHDQVLWALHMSGMEDLLLYLSGSEDEEQYCFHILEIISLMLREHKPETLAGAGNPRSVSEKESDVQRLMALRKKEELAKAQRLKTILPARFNGSFYVKNMKSISDREYISHKLITNTHAVSFDTEKSGRRRPKNRLPVSDNEISRRSTLSVCLFLKNFCVEILNNSYNVLMSLVKKKLLRERSEDHDESYYLWAMSYFMEFNRLNNFQLAFVSETISVQIFHYIQTQLDSFYEMMLSDRKKTKVWSKRMHLGLKSYKELLLTLCAMSNSQDETVVQCASVIKGNIFYVIEYREMLLSLLSNFDEVKFSLAYLKDLVEATHVFLRMLEKHSKKHSHLVVQKKVRKIQKKKKKTVTSHLPPLDDQNEVGWEAISGKLSALLQGRGTVPTDISPFDAASESSIDEQKTEVLYKIFEAMHKEEAGNAVALLRSAREVWPEDNAFGSPDVEPEEEFLALREIFFANLKRTSPAAQNEEEEESSPDDDEENEDNYSSTFAEQQLDLGDFFKRFGSPKVVQPYCLLMANYKKNEPHTNLCIVKMLHRIAWDCKMHGLLFQASVFLVFQNVLSDPDQHFDPAIKELARLAKYIVNKFFSAAEKNKKMFVELLFWKGPREVYEIEEGYGSYNSMSSKAAAWTEEEEEELKYLYEENKNVIDDGEDVVEVIRKLMKNKDRTNKRIIHKLKTMGLVENTQSLHPKASRLRNQWLEDEILELQHLFEEYKSSDDILGNLLKYITVTKSKQSVIAKLLELKLITDRKELWKKRAKKQNNSGSRRHAGASGSENDSESGYSDENDVTDNTDSDVSNQVKNKDEWDERELEELCTLYAKHKDSPQCIESIASELSFEANLNNVVSKLTEQGLINPDDENVIASLQNAVTSTNSSASHKHKPNKTHTKKDLEKKRSKSKEWHESEIIELNHLFEEHKESGDVLHNIMTNLIIKRPKKSVVEKLLELGLVSDKKDLRKKRATAKTKNKQSEIPSRQLSSTSKNVSQQEIDGDNIQESSKNVGLALEKLKHRKQQKKKDSSSSAFPSNSTSEQSESTALQSTTEENKRRRHLILGESDSSDDETLSSIKSSLSKSFSKRQISEDKVNSKKIAKGLKSSDTLKLKKKQHVLNDTDSSEDEALIHIKSSQKGRPNDTVLGADKTEDMATVSKRKRSALMDDSSSSDNETLNNIQAALSKDHSIEPSVEVRLNSKSVGRSVSEKPRRKHRVLDSDSSEDEILSEVKSSVKDLQSTDLISSENDPPESGTSEVRASKKFSSDSRVEVSRENAGSSPVSNLGGSDSFVKETSNDITSAVQDGSISEVNLNRTFDNETNVSPEGSDVLPHNSSNNTVAQSKVRNNILKDRNSQLAVQELLFCSTDSLMTNHAVLDSVPGDINPDTQKLPSYHPADETVAKKHKKRHSVLDESDSSENEEFSRKTLVKKKRVQILDDSD